MKLPISIALSSLACMLLVFATGCGASSQASASKATVESERARLVLKDEPAGALPVLLVREDLDESKPVVVLGEIGGVASPWEPGKASFMMIDPSVAAVAADAHVCNDPGCHFCQKNKENEPSSLAIVEFSDASGNVLPVDARELFGIGDRELVVIRGRAKVNELGHLVVAADGIYVRR